MRYTLDNFYQSKQWSALLQVIRNERLNEQGEIICEHCGQPITAKYDCIGHHKTYLTEANVNDALIALNPENIALVHHRCHNKIHEKFEYKPKTVYLVWGAPLSGKSTYVESIRERGDLILDIDNIWQAISGCERYDKPERLNANVFGVRDTLLEQIRYRRGKWNTAYVIGGYPLSGERERLIASLGAREIFIDTSQEECMSRLQVCNDGRNKKEWEKYISDWFRKNNPPHLGLK